MSLHPEVEKEIEAGPLAVEVDHDTGKVKKREHPQEFARRIALRAVELEREECAKVAESGSFLHEDAPDARFGRACAAAIRRRGKP